MEVFLVKKDQLVFPTVTVARNVITADVANKLFDPEPYFRDRILNSLI